MSTETTTNVITGLSLLGLSVCLELLCLFITRILAHSTRGGHVSTFRMWLHVSAAIEQIAFIIFHVKYHFLTPDFKIPDSCIILRFLSTVASTLTNCWLFVIASYYLMLTINPSKCSTFHSRVLSHCFTWMWTCASCLMYLMLSFLLKEEYHVQSIHTCWENISSTIHMYLTLGNEIIPFILTCMLISCARCRVPVRREMRQCSTQHSEYNVDVKSIINSINRFLILASLLSIYYISIVFRTILDESGSNLTLMLLQSSKGILIATMACFLSNDVIFLIFCGKVAKPDVRYNCKTTVANTEGTDIHEMETFTFESQNNFRSKDHNYK